MRRLAIPVECVAGLHEHRAVSRQQGGLAVWKVGEYLRHHRGDDDLEEERTCRQESRQVSSDMPAHGHEAGKEGHDAKEQGDNLKGEQEPGHEEVMFVVAIDCQK